MGEYGLKTISYIKGTPIKSIAHVIKHANFQLYRIHPDGIIWKT